MKEKSKKKKIEAAAAITAVVLALYILSAVPVIIAEDGPIDEPGTLITVYVGDVTVTLTATDNIGVDETYCFVGSTPPADPSDPAWIEYTDPFIVSGVGVQTVHYFSKDINGNVEWPCKSTSFEIGVRDDSAPETDCALDGEQQQILVS